VFFLRSHLCVFPTIIAQNITALLTDTPTCGLLQSVQRAREEDAYPALVLLCFLERFQPAPSKSAQIYRAARPDIASQVQG